ncbi:phospholipase SGR2 isoform X2 [Telopea speciosissima]|uniref:phospholipase SGR2 isoform X2 n=1 Tax=Telopea speciosissima TaxID=54955 RepID=UPI001CC7B5C5|nr:phospholipase SGR2 isoform X2 [Telopea speciosissima]
MANSEAKDEVSYSRTHSNGREGEGEVAASGSDATGSYGVVEISPELLKNTPSNIARLEDVIEQCRGREKYLARTRSPSDGEDVRWYFCKVPLAENELAASVPRTPVVGKSEYFRFGMRDSLALEASFLQREEELLSCWWKEYAECSEGPRVQQLRSESKSVVLPKADDGKSNQLDAVEAERVGVPVKGGLYEVDLAKRHCFPVYWLGENRRVLRGHWFAREGGLDWLPLREDVAEQLEFAYRSQVWHRRTFQPSGLFAARVDLQGSIQGLHALFTGEDDTWEVWMNYDASGFSNVVGFRGNGIKLRRGYSSSGSLKPTQDELRQQKEEEMDDYCSQVPVRHLVFMVHGIGQRLEKANLVDDVGDFRHVTATLAERHLTSYQRDTQRVLFIPCQWRKRLKLSGESAVEKITLDGVRGLRTMLGATVHDVLYYMSPIYCQDIINSVSNQLNWLYLKFIKRNPGYDGKVSIYGHSLGSVLSYDILCHQENISSPVPMDLMFKEHVIHEESPSDAINQSSKTASVINLMDVDSTVNDESLKGLVGTIKEETLLSQLNALVNKEDGTRDSSITVDSSPILDSEDLSPTSFDQSQHLTEGTDTKQQMSSLVENGQEPRQSSSDMLLEEGNCLDSTTSRSRYLENANEIVPEDSCDKDKLIELLRIEVDSLKVGIAQLKSQCSSSKKSDSGVDSTTTRQLVSQKHPPEQADKPNNYKPYVKYPKLEFKVDTFFAVGSPLGVFLAVRNIRIGIGQGKEYWQDESISEEIPACRQMINIFHPFDPVAYRVEPLVCKENIAKRPVIIPYHKGGKRLHIGFQEFTEDLAARSQAVVNQFNSMRKPQKRMK